MNKILVTGGAGFIGSAVIRQLVTETDATVINVDKLTYAGNLQSLKSVSDNPRYLLRTCGYLRCCLQSQAYFINISRMR